MLDLLSLSFIELGEAVFYNIYDIRINGSSLGRLLSP